MKRILILLGFILISTNVWAGSASPTLNISVDHGVPLTLSAPASSVFIANPDIADVQVMSPTSIMVFGKRTGETTFMASDSNGRTLAQRTVVVLQDLSGLRQELDAAIPGNKIKLQTLPNGIVMTGEARDAGAVADAYRLAQRYLSAGGDIINRIKVVGSNQINIRVRFAEVSRSIDNTLGFNWDSIGNVGGFAFGIASGSAIGSGASILSTRPNNSGLNQANNIIGLSKTGQHFNVNGVIDALAQDGLVRILAEPNLTAMSGETASFLAGGEFPNPIPQGNGTISIEYKKYGISLEFTPTLISEDRINLHVKPEVSKLTSNGTVIINNFSLNALTVRKAETTIEVASGQSFAIAGLMDNDQTQTINKYPLLGDLPILGDLFRSDRFQNGQTELVIIITPYIVKPSSDQQMALPTDGYSPPSENDRLFRQRYSSSDPNARKVSGDPVARRSESINDEPVAAINPDPAPALIEPETNPAPAPAAAPRTDVMPAFAVPTPSARNEAAPAVPVTIQVDRALPQAPLIKLNPAKAAPLPLRAGNTTQAPAGPGGFILE